MVEQQDSCSYCNNKLSQRGYYCGNCLHQVKCKNCRSILEKDNKGCVECGEPLASGSSISDNRILPSSKNKFSFKQNGNNKAFEAEFSDEVGSTLTGVFATLIGNGTIKPKLSIKGAANTPSENVLILQSTNKTANIEDARFADVFEDENAILERFFRQEDDKIIVVDTRVKHTGKLDQAVRITLLLLYVYKNIGKSQVERAIIIEELDRCKLVNSHYKSWLTNASVLMVRNGLIELSVPGEEKALKIIEEIADPTILKGDLNSDKAGRSNKSSRKKKSGSSGTSSGLEDDKSRLSKTKSNSAGPMAVVSSLISDGYFITPKNMGDIIRYLKETKAIHLKNSDLSSTLGRLLKKGDLQRKKNTSDNQYEYFSPSNT
jgi:hypothetical protein